MASLLLLHRASYLCVSALATKRTLLSALPSTYPSSSTSFSASASSPSPPSAAEMEAADDPIAFRERRTGFSSLWPNYRSRVVHSHGRMLLRIMHQREWDAALEDELANADVFLTHHIVDQVVACIPSAKLALQFFIWAGEGIGYPPPTSKATYDITQWYAHKSQLVSFLSILRCLENPNFHLSPSRVNVLLQGYGWAGMLDRAYGVMSRIQGFSNDILVHCFLFSIMTHYRYDMVYDVYMELKKLHTPLDVCYNVLIQGMSLAGGERWQDADLLFKQMVDSGQVPNVVACNALVVSISKAGKHERTYALLQDMIEKKVRLENATVDSAVECLCQAKQLQRVSRLIEEMKQRGCLLSSNVYDSFLAAVGDVED
eukprot:c20113_g1_i2 orf=281-1399(-)